MTSIWQSFVSYHVAYELWQHPDGDPTEREQRFEAVLLFADVSGFTAMSEALATLGKPGAEGLTAVLNHYFEPMIALIRSYGGIVGKFGGDAMTIFFPCDNGNQREIGRRAIQCALHMQAEMSKYATIETRVGTFSLSMKMGLAIGSIFCTTVGDPRLRLEHIIAGQALDLCVAAEHLAQDGEIITHQRLVDVVGHVRATPRQDRFLHVHSLELAAQPVSPHSLLNLSPRQIELLAAYIHPIVAQRIQRGQLHLLNEHRQVTVMFVRFEGFDYNAPTVHADLQAYLTAVFHIVHRYGGYLNKVDMGDKGSKYIILFGAPIAHEDDEERALACALELRDLRVPALATQPTIGIGIRTGYVYCGQVGSPQRQEYTVMGYAVNLAARLMQVARPGELLVSHETQSGLAQSFRWSQPQSLYVHGRSEPVEVYALLAAEQAPILPPLPNSYALPMVGRQAEREQLLHLLAQAGRGQGQLVGIVAEAGLGKSRLVASVVKRVEDRFHCLYGECHSYATSTSYLVWRTIWRGLLGVDGALSLEQQRQQAEAALTAVSPKLAPRLPLLQSILNLPIPDNDLTAPLDAELRKASLENLLVDVVRGLARKRPLCLILEDIQWIDPLSLELLQVIARNSSDIPLALLLTYRPHPQQHQETVRGFAHFTELVLAEFTADEAAELVRVKGEMGEKRPLPPTLIQTITERAQGNPFYLDEMLNFIYEQQADIPDVAQLELPDSLHNLLISRLDQLADEAKTTLKVASVVGRLFRADWLWGSYPQLGTPEAISSHLTDLTHAYLTPVDTPDAALTYLFRHIILRDVAYESLAVATRMMLHEQVAHFIEQQYPGQLEQHLDALVYHYGLSRNEDRQRHYFALAAQTAQANYANETAIEHYQRLLPLLPAAEQGDILLKLGEVYQLVGQWENAEQMFAAALQQFGQQNDTVAMGHSLRKLGTLQRSKGAYETALSQLQEAQTLFETANAQQPLADTLQEMGIVYMQQGEFDRALALFQQCQRLTETIGDKRGQYRAIGNIGGLYYWQDELEQALAQFEQCHQLALELNDRLILSRSFGNIGNVYLEQGDLARALASYSENLRLAAEIGYLQGVSISIGNIGNLYLAQGDCASALVCNTYNLSVALELGDVQGVVFALWLIGHAFLCQGDHEAAALYMERAVTLGRKLDIPYDLCEYLYDLGRVYALQNRFALAQQCNAEAVELAEAMQHERIQFLAQIALIVYWVQLGKIKPFAGVNELRQMLLVASSPEEQALVHYEVWRMDASQERDRQEAAALYHHLYALNPTAVYRHRYQELTGVALTAVVHLPDLPDVVAHFTTTPQTLLQQVNQLIRGYHESANGTCS